MIFRLITGFGTILEKPMNLSLLIFQKQNEFRAIIDFPDKGKEYTSDELWPFFTARIPTLNQPYHFKKIARANADKDDPVQLLRIFGNETITNPYRFQAI